MMPLSRGRPAHAARDVARRVVQVAEDDRGVADGDDLPGDMGAGIGGEQRGEALQILFAAQAGAASHGGRLVTSDS